MSKVMFFNLPEYGHMNPTLPLVEELVRHGEEVIYYSTAGFRERIEKTGSIFRHYGKLSDATTRYPSNPIKFAEALLSLTAELLPQLLEDVSHEQVDYLIHDSACLWGWALAQTLRIPAVCSTATFALNAKTVKEMNKRSAIPGAQLAITALANASSAFNIWRKAHQLRRTYHINIFVRKILNIFINRSELNLVYTSKELQPMVDEFDDNYRFVGAMISPHKDIDSPFLEDVEGKTVIYISLGTARNNRPDFYHACLSAFENTEYLVVMSVGRNIDIRDLGPLPNNFMVYNFVPSQLESLKKAKLFITHGGVSAMNEGLFFGVPLLLFPQTVEQNFNARRVEEVGAGKILKESELEPDKLLQLARSLIETDSYCKSAQMIGDSLRSAGGYRRAVQEIEEFKRRFVE